MRGGKYNTKNLSVKLTSKHTSVLSVTTEYLLLTEFCTPIRFGRDEWTYDLLDVLAAPLEKEVGEPINIAKYEWRQSSGNWYLICIWTIGPHMDDEDFYESTKNYLTKLSVECLSIGPTQAIDEEAYRKYVQVKFVLNNYRKERGLV